MAMKGLFFFTIIAFSYGTPHEERKPKWFLGGQAVTSVVYRRQLVTELQPSSCVVADATLPPCRNVRSLESTSTPPLKIKPTNMAAFKPVVAPTTATGWNWFGNGKTVTSILHTTITVRKIDPSKVVTFSVKGCLPSRLPFDLPRCEQARASKPSGREDNENIPEIHYANE